MIENKILKTDLIDWRDLEWLQGDLKDITDESFGKLKKSIKDNDFIQPFNVWENGKSWILDGHHRLKALKELEKEGTKIPILLPANFIKCKNKKEASKLVLVYSSIYANVTEQGLTDFMFDNKLDIGDLSELDLPNLDMDVFGFNGGDDGFNLPDGDKEPFQQITFTLADIQAEFIKDQLRTTEIDSQNFNNENSNGNAIYSIVKQWAEQKK